LKTILIGSLYNANNYLSNIIIEAAQPSRIRDFAACVINLCLKVIANGFKTYRGE